MMFTNSLIAASGLVSMVSAHGLMVSPPVRAIGPQMNATCGPAVVAMVEADPTSHVEGLPEAAAKDAGFNAEACNLFLCKGFQFADNIKNVQKFTPGEVVNIKANISIPHTGPANVSVVRTANNSVIGTSMISFPVYADDAASKLPANNSNFNITMPSNLGSSCTVPGACVVQWFWVGTKSSQTYESCMDFTMPGNATSRTIASGASEPASPSTSKGGKNATEPSTTTGGGKNSTSTGAGGKGSKPTTGPAQATRNTGAKRRAQQGGVTLLKKRQL